MLNSTNRSRFNRAKVMDAIGVTLLMLFSAAMGMIMLILSSPAAKADADPESVAYAAHYGGAVCAVLAEYPSTNGLQGILNSVQSDGLSAYQAGTVVALSVYESCPRFTYILILYVAKNGRSYA